MSVYFLAHIRIHDDEIYQRYLNQCDDIFTSYNGTYLVLDSEPLQLEGTLNYTKTVLIEFPDQEGFENWYYSRDYQEILKYRLSGAVCDSLLLRGNT